MDGAGCLTASCRFCLKSFAPQPRLWAHPRQAALRPRRVMPAYEIGRRLGCTTTFQGTEMTAKTKKVKSAYEIELHAGKRCADMLRGLSLESQRRVIANLHQHLDEATGPLTISKPSADPRQLPVPGTEAL